MPYTALPLPDRVQMDPDASLTAAQRHLAASLSAISGHYMGEHWLASFALLALRPEFSISRPQRARVQ